MDSRKQSILVITGETSGETHAAGLIEQMKLQNPHQSLDWFGSGGSHMAAAGVELLSDVSQLGAIGTWDALALMGRYFSLYRNVLKEAERRRPLLAVLVDFPDFNLRIVGKLKALNIPICYFIGPQVWAWRQSRLKQIKRCVDLMLVILPFEEAFFRDRGIEAHYVGNPCTKLRRFLSEDKDSCPDSKPYTVALLPGSRTREVENILPIQLDAASWIAQRHSVRFWIVKAPEIHSDRLQKIYDRWRKNGKGEISLEIRHEEASELLSRACCAIVKSGTSTLEAAILQVPFAMVYRLPRVSYFLARPRVKTAAYCLPNLIAGEQVVPEFVQSQAKGEKIGDYLSELLGDRKRRDEVRNGLLRVTEKLGDGDAYCEGARHITRFLKKSWMMQG